MGNRSRVVTHCYRPLKFTEKRNFSKVSDRKVWTNSADPDQTAPLRSEEQSDLGLHCLHLSASFKRWH